MARKIESTVLNDIESPAETALPRYLGANIKPIRSCHRDRFSEQENLITDELYAIRQILKDNDKPE